MKHFRRITAAALVFITVMMLCLGALPLSASAAEDISVTNGTGTRGAHSLTAPLGYRVNILAPFTGFGFTMPTWVTTNSGATLSVYKWQGSYKATTDGDPIAKKAFSNIKDNATNWVEFDAQDPGEYLFLITYPIGSAGVWLNANPTDSIGRLYINGIEQSGDPELSIRFPEKPAQAFGECSVAEDAVDGNHQAPPEAEIPEDSLIRTHEVMPDTWVFTDGLGRVSLTNADVGNPREDKTVAMFYWTWHINFKGGPCYNITEILKKYPEAINDYDHYAWNSVSGQPFWNEPIWGYYANDDAWVVRRQGEMLANAGVDTIVTDNSNGTFTWQSAYRAVLESWAEAKADGVNTPKISFLLPFAGGADTATQLRSLYTDMFRNNDYQDQWFYWEGKPLIMAQSRGTGLDKKDLLDKEILNFFTYRPGHPGYTYGNGKGYGMWGWLSISPQAVFYATRADMADNIPEQTTVGVAMNHSYSYDMIAAMNGSDIMGRSYTTDYENRYKVEGAEASKWGYNFAEQWNNALAVDPKLIFVTGWNEWTAGRHQTWPEGYASAVENAFPDQCNDEFSRDIEPSKGDLQDHYYYQLVNNVRRYKGARPIPTPSGKATIDITADNTRWNTVEPYYAAYIGNTDDRDAIGYNQIRYTEYSGRNDIIGARVARNDEYVYFYVECNEDISPYTDPLWMNLYIDSDGENAGWNTFDFVLNKTAPTADKATLEKFTGNGYATEKVGEVDYTVSGKYMQVKVPKSMLNLSGDDYTINFTWTDNVHDADNHGKPSETDYVYTRFSGDIMDFYTSGDVAPGGRFKFSYISTAENATAEETTPETTPDTMPDTMPDTTEDTTPDTVSDTMGDTLPETTPDTVLDTTPGTASDTAAETQPADSGCSSVMGVSGCAALLLLAAAVFVRPRED